jgi:hypothetical protein
MSPLKSKGRIAALAACCLLSLAASARAEPTSQYRSYFGAFADAGRYDREIVVSPDTCSVNVASGQVIRFVVLDAAGANTAFTWSFDTWGGRVADLSRIAPSGMLRRPVRVYIADDPRYGG